MYFICSVQLIPSADIRPRIATWRKRETEWSVANVRLIVLNNKAMNEKKHNMFALILCIAMPAQPFSSIC